MEEEEDTTRTTVKTLWTETVLEILYELLRKNRSDKDLREMLVEVRAKGFKPDDIIARVKKKVDDEAAARVRNLMKKK